MARTDTLSNFLTDVADAIREKKGTSETITASNFDTEIENLPSGADLSEYFEQNFDSTMVEGLNKKYIKKMPDVIIADSLPNLGGFAYNYKLSKIPKIICGSSITSMNGLYNGCSNVTEIDVSGLNTVNVIDMSSMFNGCTALTTLNIGNFNTEKCTNMKNMFSNCSVISNINFSNFRTGLVQDMSGMFARCKQVRQLDLSAFNTSNVANMSNMFYGCTSLIKLDIRNMVFDNVTKNTTIFGSSNDAVPSNCEIIVKSQTEKDWVLARRSDFTNVKTVAEYEAE